MKDIEEQLAWTTHEPWTTSTPDQQSLDLWRMMLRQVPAITDLSLIDGAGREQLRVSRLSLDEIGSQLDYSKDPKFLEAALGKPYRSRGLFSRRIGTLHDDLAAGAQCERERGRGQPQIHLGRRVADQGRRARPGLCGRRAGPPDCPPGHQPGAAQHRSVRPRPGAGRAHRSARVARSRRNWPATPTAARCSPPYAAIAPLDWTMFVELPVDEAYAPLYSLIARVSILILLGLLLAFIADLVLVRWIVQPLERLEKLVSTVRRDQGLHPARRPQERRRDRAAGGGLQRHALRAVRRARAGKRDQFELARVSRLTTMGAMTASIAHEINQPLAAIAANANAGLRWLVAFEPRHRGGACGAQADQQRRASRRRDHPERPVDLQEGPAAGRPGRRQRASIQEVLALVHGELISHRVAVKTDLDRRPAAGARRSRPAPAGHPQPDHQRGRGHGHGRRPATGVDRHDAAAGARRRADPRAGHRPRHRSRAARIASSTRSFRRNRAGWAWACSSAARSSRRTAGTCGRRPRSRKGRSST